MKTESALTNGFIQQNGLIHHADRMQGGTLFKLMMKYRPTGTRNYQMTGQNRSTDDLTLLTLHTTVTLEHLLRKGINCKSEFLHSDN